MLIGLRGLPLGRRVGNERGSVLLAVMIIGVVVLIAVVSMLSVVREMTRTAARRRAGHEAFYAAESGIARALSYIQDQPKNIFEAKFSTAQTSKSNQFHPWQGAQIVDVNLADLAAANGADLAYQVGIYSVVESGISRLKIECTGKSTLGPTAQYRRITVAVQPGSFARYAFFNSTSLSTMDGNPRWLGGGENFWGPVHSNRYLFNGLYAAANNQLNFHSDVTIVRNDIMYDAGSAAHVHFNGVKETNAQYVELPTDLSLLTGAADAGGINLPYDDPYYAVNYDANPSNNVATPPATFNGHPIYNYEFAFNGSSVTVTNLARNGAGNLVSQWTVPLSTINGAIVANDANVFVHGNLDGKVTIAAIGTTAATPTAYNAASNGNVIVNGNITYSGHPAGQLTTLNPDLTATDDVLGLIATRNFALDGSVPTDCTVDAHMMITGQATANPDVRTWPAAGTGNIPAAVGQDGAFFVEDGIQSDLSYIWSNGVNDLSGADTGWNQGNLYLNGGVVHFIRGQTFNGSTGYNRRYSFDERLLYNPPPYYPLTQDSFIASWKEERHSGGSSYDF